MASSTRASFVCVFVPAAADEPMTEWTVSYDAADADSAVGCLMDRLQQHYRDQDACYRATAPAAEQAGRREQVAHALKGAMTTMPTASSTGSTSSQEHDAGLVDALAGMTHLVGQVALVDACRESGFDAVTMYVRDLEA